MITLLLPGLLPDNADTVYDMGRENMLYAVVLMIFIVVAAITLMNMLIGVLVEGVSTVAAVEKEGLNLSYVKEQMQRLFLRGEKATNCELSMVDLERTLNTRQAKRVFASVGVDVQGLLDVAAFHLFRTKDTVTFPDFLELVLQLRGTNSATVRDVVNLRKFIAEEVWKSEERMMEAISQRHPSAQIAKGGAVPSAGAGEASQDKKSNAVLPTGGSAWGPSCAPAPDLT